jgi:hypothetical protein
MCGAKGCAPVAPGSEERMVVREAEGAENLQSTRRGASAQKGKRNRGGSTGNCCSPASWTNCLEGRREFRFSSGLV